MARLFWQRGNNFHNHSKDKPLITVCFFESAQSLFSELTPIRLELLNVLSQVGSCSVYTLAKNTARNSASVQTDVTRLEELGLIEKNHEGAIFVPFESVEIVMPLAKTA